MKNPIPYVQVNADVAEESITEREGMVIDVPPEDTLNDTERRRNSQWNNTTSVELARAESRPRSSDDDANTTYGLNLWGDAMGHMREISEFARGDNPDEVGAMTLDSDSITGERRLAEELAVELERQRLTMQYHHEVPGFQSWFNRFHTWDSKECENLCGDSKECEDLCGDSNMSFQTEGERERRRESLNCNSSDGEGMSPLEAICTGWLLVDHKVPRGTELLRAIRLVA